MLGQLYVRVVVYYDGPFTTADVLPDMPSLMRRVCSGYAPLWGELQTPLV
jgi:hypothetical protein